MPHFKDGTLAKNGDLALKIDKDEQGIEVVGVISKINRAETCNAEILPLAMRQRGVQSWLPVSPYGPFWMVTLSDCMRIDPSAMESALPQVLAAANTS
jgi:hypothetical protein